MAVERNWERVPENTIGAIEALERHAYVKITELIDAGEFDAAEQVTGILEGLGII